MNVEIGAEAKKFLFWEYLFQILGIVSLQCRGEAETSAVDCNLEDFRNHAKRTREAEFKENFGVMDPILELTITHFIS
jgi:hypothetical protein